MTKRLRQTTLFVEQELGENRAKKAAQEQSSSSIVSENYDTLSLAEAECWSELSSESNTCEHHSSDSCSSNSSSSMVPTDISRSKTHMPIQPVLKRYPRRMFGSGVNERERCFSDSWYGKYSFIEYSIAKDAVFCFPCRFFSDPTKHVEHAFTTGGFRAWKTIGKVLRKHHESIIHLRRHGTLDCI